MHKICSIFSEVLPEVRHNDQTDKIPKIYIYHLKLKIYGRWPEEPAILIFKLLCACPPCMYLAFIWALTKNEWNAGDAIWSCAFGPSIICNLITRIQQHSIGARSIDPLQFSPCMWIESKYKKEYTICISSC